MINDDLQRRAYELGEELAKLGQAWASASADRSHELGVELAKLGEGLLASAYAHPQASPILWGLASAASSAIGGQSLVSLVSITVVLDRLGTEQLHSENKQLKEDVAKLRQDVAKLQLRIRG